MFSRHIQKEKKLITQHYEIQKHYETSLKKNTENNVPKKAFAMTCFDLQQIILIKYIYGKSFINSSQKHKEISGFEVFKSTYW